MERPIFKPIGTTEEELDTPTLVVDLDKLGRNIDKMAEFFNSSTSNLRPHIAAHGSPAIAHMQMAAGGTVGGIAATTLGQAEVFAANGFNDIYISNIIVAKTKIQRLCALAERSKVIVNVDNLSNVQDLSDSATSNNVIINVVVDINTRLGRTGVDPGLNAVELSKFVNKSSGLHFSGLSTYEGTMLATSDEALQSESRKWIQQVLDTREDIERQGIHVEVVSVGGTYNYEIAGAMQGVTEVPAGSYALMDGKYQHNRKQFVNAARVMACVTSIPEAGKVITDAGRKAIGSDSGDPNIDQLPGASVSGLSAEHGTLVFDANFAHNLKLADRVWFIPNNIAGTVNVHDYIFAVRDRKLKEVWELPARGRYR